MKRAVGFALVFIGVFLAVVTGRMFMDGKARFDKGLSLADDGDDAAALVAFEDAARSYVPGSPIPRKALDRMRIMAKGAHMRGDADRSAHIWEVIRRSVIATRHVIQPNEDFLIIAEGGLAKLASIGPDEDAAVRDLSRPKDPSPVLSLALFAGLLGWILGGLWFLWGARSEREASEVGGKAAGLVSLVGMVTWVVCAWLAG